MKQNPRVINQALKAITKIPRKNNKHTQKLTLDTILDKIGRRVPYRRGEVRLFPTYELEIYSTFLKIDCELSGRGHILRADYT